MTDTPAAPPVNWRTNPWVVFILPFAVFLIANTFEPSPPEAQTIVAQVAAAPAEGVVPPSEAELAYQRYPLIYGVKVALTLAAIAFVWPGYRQLMPVRFGFLAILVGGVGAALWIGLWHIDLESHLGLRKLMSMVGLASRRSAFNPFEQLDSPGMAWAFMALRLFGLALVVPLIEEMFYRGFVMRFVIDRDWPNVPFGKVTPMAAAAAIVLPMLSHPEIIAAACWFGLMVWLYWKTKNIWDCVAAHATTNGLLGLYVVTSSRPEVWQLL
jgi:CAAX prenyl protease-like protein